MANKGRLVQLTPLAKADLESIWLYTFKQWSLDQANQYHRDLFSTIEALACGNKLGRVCSVKEGYFSYTAGKHVVFYRETEQTLDVIRVLHQRMDIKRHL